jgi:mannose-1-phosphate guanylyltransferase
MDIGQPKDFLEGVRLYLANLELRNPSLLTHGDGILGNVLIDSSAVIESGSLIGPNVSIGPNCLVRTGARVANSVMLEGSSVGSHSLVKGSIIGWKSHIGKWGRLEGLSVLGEDVKVADEICLNATIVLPHKDLKESVLEPKQIIM